MNMQKIMRKMGLVTLVFVGTISSPIHGTSDGKPSENFDGFYAGASLGYLNQATSLDAKQNPGNRFAHMNKTTTYQGTPVAEVFLGWGKELGNGFYGGLEGKVDWVLKAGKKVAEDTNFIYQSSRSRFGGAILVRLGYFITPTTLIYGGIGVKHLKFSHNLFEKADKIPAPFSQKTRNLLTEVGVETALGGPRPWRFRLAYGYMPQKTITRSAPQFPMNHMYQDQGILKTSGAEHAIKAGVVYRF